MIILDQGNMTILTENKICKSTKLAVQYSLQYYVVRYSDSIIL